MVSIATYLQSGKHNVGNFFRSLFNSYSQIFFSTYRPFSILILVVSFFDLNAGLAGFITVLTTSLIAYLLNYHKPTVAMGFYGFNSLLVGLGLGIIYTMSWQLLFILILASIFTFFISISMQGVIGKYALPFLSVPFLISIWTFMLATNNFEALGISERGIYTLNELYGIGGEKLVRGYEFIQELPIPQPIRIYVLSLSAIIFQYSIISGVVIAIGLLFYSRIAFSLSVIGFMVAFLFYRFIGADITDIDYSYIGFNYILTSIAVGGFFLIPSRSTYLWVVLLIPLVAIITISSNMVLMQIGLPVYSLPFNVVVLLFIYALKWRMDYSYTLSEVYFQHNSPEKNLYIFLNNRDRFRYRSYIQVKLPFFGEWHVSQGHQGEHTHRGKWKHAWDFVIFDQHGKQYKDQGDYPQDYYCYGKPVIAPEDGVVEKVVNDIEDNIIGEVDLENNWGNTVIIKHDDNLYTKISHLKKNSIKVNEGEKISYGQVIGSCGNSGRSPYPHLHFQVQQYPYIGSVTLDYPISAYIINSNGEYRYCSHTRPGEGELVSNIISNEIIREGFRFTPGQEIAFQVDSQKQKSVHWIVKVSEENQPYIYCRHTRSTAYFENDNNQFYFTYFEGSKKSFLYQFFLAGFKVQEGFYQDLVLKDSFPLYLTFPKYILWFHDFISPFVRIIRSSYALKYSEMDDYIHPSVVTLESELTNYVGKRVLNRRKFTLRIGRKGIRAFIIHTGNREIELNPCEA